MKRALRARPVNRALELDLQKVEVGHFWWRDEPVSQQQGFCTLTEEQRAPSGPQTAGSRVRQGGPRACRAGPGPTVPVEVEVFMDIHFIKIKIAFRKKKLH